MSLKSLFIFSVALLPIVAAANAEREVQITIEKNIITPKLIEAVEGETLVLKVKNNDALMEEFESNSLSFEKLIGGKKSATIYVGPLKPGSYEFFGEFHKATANGKIVVKPK